MHTQQLKLLMLLQAKDLQCLTRASQKCTLRPMEHQTCFQCGRPAQPHCPQCGSLRKYAFANKHDTATRPDGSIARLRVYRCLTCANTYNDDEWQLRCQAPAQRLGRPPLASRDEVWNPKVPQLEPDLNVSESLMAKFRKKYGGE